MSELVKDGTNERMEQTANERFVFVLGAIAFYPIDENHPSLSMQFFFQ